MPERFTVTKTEASTPDYLLEEAATGKLLNDLSDNGKRSGEKDTNTSAKDHKHPNGATTDVFRTHLLHSLRLLAV